MITINAGQLLEIVYYFDVFSFFIGLSRHDQIHVRAAHPKAIDAAQALNQAVQWNDIANQVISIEIGSNFNPILIFILTPMVTALTSQKDTYLMMIIGTFVMASPTFLLALGPSIYTLFGYLIIMTIGEAMWQPRFLQWVAEIAPKDMTGIYMGIGQFPWFLTKVVTSLYSGWFLMMYCPSGVPPGQMNTEVMWLIYGLIAIMSPVGLLLARRWMKRGFKTKHEG